MKLADWWVELCFVFGGGKCTFAPPALEPRFKVPKHQSKPPADLINGHSLLFWLPLARNLSSVTHMPKQERDGLDK